MRKSICAKVDEELPLYAGGDLPPRRARRVTEHLRDCVRCSTSAEEWCAAREDLKLYAAPVFEEQIFSDIRAGVLRELAVKTPASHPYPIFSWWRKQQLPAFAAAALALLVLPVTLTQLLSSRSAAPDAVESAAPVNPTAAPPRPELPAATIDDGALTAPPELRATRVAARHPARPSASPRALLDSVTVSSTGAVPAFRLLSPTLPAAPVAASDIDARVLEPAQWDNGQEPNDSQVITITTPLPQFK